MALECSNCGSEVREADDFCSNCGTTFVSEQSSTAPPSQGTGSYIPDFSEKQYAAIGGVSGVISFGFLPPLFGVVSILCGVQLYKHFDKKLGGAIIILGTVGLIVGMYIGAQSFA